MLRYGRYADIVFAQDTISVGLPALGAARVLGRPFVLRVPGDYAWEQAVQRFGVVDSIDAFQSKRYGFRTELLRRMQSFVARHASKVIAPSEYFRTLVSGWGVDAAKLVRIYNGVLVPPGVERAARSANVLFAAGRLVPWKRFDLLLDAIARIPAAELVIAGDGPERDTLELYAKRIGVHDRVRFLGRLPREELLSELARARAFVLPSSFESFSFQLVEAMMVGTPVIACAIGNLGEIITDGENGILVEPDSAPALASAIERVMSDDMLAEKLSSAARKKSAAFSVEATASELESLFRSL